MTSQFKARQLTKGFALDIPAAQDVLVRAIGNKSAPLGVECVFAVEARVQETRGACHSPVFRRI